MGSNYSEIATRLNSAADTIEVKKRRRMFTELTVPEQRLFSVYEKTHCRMTMSFLVRFSAYPCRF